MRRRGVAAVFFDLDGTLVDSLPGLCSALEKTLGCGEFEPDAVRGWVGDGAAALVARAWSSRRGDEVPPEFVELFELRLAEAAAEGVRVYPGIRTVLRELSARGAGLAVVTNKPHGAACRVIEECFGSRVFEFVRGAADERPRKPDPGILVEGLLALGVPASRAVMVGDSDIDMAAGLAAGVVPVGVGWGYRDRGRLLASGARQVVEDPAAAPAVVR